MKWTVVWLPTALRKLGELWLDASDRAEITAAANHLEQLLKHNPLHSGEGRADDKRLLVLPPLVVLYRVDEDDCKVSVVGVWKLMRKV